jgi:hypothetical protein
MMANEYNDYEITCCDCNNPFTFSAGEQQFFAERKPVPFTPPKRCKPCRDQRKAQKQPQQDAYSQPEPNVWVDDGRDDDRGNRKERGRRRSR